MSIVVLQAFVAGTVASMIISWVLLRWHKRNPSEKPLNVPSAENLPFLKVVVPAWLVLQLLSETALFLVASIGFLFAIGMLVQAFGSVGGLVAFALAVGIFMGAVTLLRARWEVGKRLYRQPETVPERLVLWWVAPGLVTVPAAVISLVDFFG